MALRCTECEHPVVRWVGRCPKCHRWNTIAATTAAARDARDAQTWRELGNESATPEPELVAEPTSVSLADVVIREVPRHATGLPAFDRVLGGGLPRDAVVALGAEPGSGKSTGVIQILARLHACCLLATGEESIQQVAQRAQRIGCIVRHVTIMAEQDLDAVLAEAERVGAEVIAIDSVHVMVSADAPGAPGSPSQLRAIADKLRIFCKHDKDRPRAAILIAHVNADGDVAGAKTIRHMVDTVLELGTSGDALTLSASKNRYGAITETATLRMTERGLVDA